MSFAALDGKEIKIGGVDIVFRRSSCTDACLEAGEMHLRAGEAHSRYANRLALLVLERGLQAFAAGPTRRILVNADPTLDDMLALAFLQRLLAGHDLPPGCRTFALYAASVHEGLRITALPLQRSLEGMYLALRHECGEDLQDSVTRARFLEDFSVLADRVFKAAEAGVNPASTPLFDDDPEFARAQEYLAHDREVYSQQDVPGGERWQVWLPRGPANAAGGLVLRQPKSILWKYWAREDPEAPGGKGYLLLGVAEKARHWRFSTDPVKKVKIHSLAPLFQKAEDAVAPGKAAADPWYDGRRHDFTLVGAPHAGTALADEEVLAIVRRWAKARAHTPGGMSLPRGTLRAALKSALCRRRTVVALGAALVAALGIGLLLLLTRGGDQAEVLVNGAPVAEGLKFDRGLESLNSLNGGALFSAQANVILQPRINNEVVFRVRTASLSPAMKLRLVLVPKEEGRLANMADFSVRVNETAAIAVKPIARSGSRVDSGYLDVPLASVGRDNHISLNLTAPGETEVPVNIRLTWQANLVFRPKLFLLAVGVSKYQNDKLSLRYADEDAGKLVQAFKEQKGRLFQDVVMESDGPVVNQAAQRKDLLKRLRWIHDHAEPQSLAIVTFSGHGKLGVNDLFYFLPHNYDEKEEPDETGISWDVFNNYLGKLPCPVLVVMDTCHSGGIGLRGDSAEKAVNEAIRKLSTERGIVVMAACRGDQSAREHSDWKSGALTLSLLEAIQGKRYYKAKARTLLPQETGCLIVTMEDLARYARGRVKELVGAQQSVVVRQTDGIYLDHIPVAVATSPAKKN